jgi:hypothetical protein
MDRVCRFSPLRMRGAIGQDARGCRSLGSAGVSRFPLELADERLGPRFDAHKETEMKRPIPRWISSGAAAASGALFMQCASHLDVELSCR